MKMNNSKCRNMSAAWHENSEIYNSRMLTRVRST